MGDRGFPTNDPKLFLKDTHIIEIIVTINIYKYNSVSLMSESKYKQITIWQVHVVKYFTLESTRRVHIKHVLLTKGDRKDRHTS